MFNAVHTLPKKKVKEADGQGTRRLRGDHEILAAVQNFWFRTKKSWRRGRRVACKASILRRGRNTRFIVTLLGHGEYGTRILYEKVYCACGEMENCIKA